MNDFLPNTDNFFKYLLTIGLILMVFVIVYPVQRQKEVDLEINSYTKDFKILEYKISRLKEDINYLKNIKTNTQYILDSLKNMLDATIPLSEKAKIEAQRLIIKSNFDEKKQRLVSSTDSLQLMNIYVESEKDKIKKLDGYFSLFKTYKIVFLIFGLLISIIGLRFWVASVYRDEKKKDEEMKTTHKSSFVRLCDQVTPLTKNKWGRITIVILLLGLLAFVIYWGLQA